jgi:protein-arginine kinase activator protein McsA
MSSQPDDNGGLGGSADPVDRTNATAVLCPDAVSDFRLRILLLGLRLKVAVRHERYHRASAILEELKELRAHDTEALVRQLHNVSSLSLSLSLPPSLTHTHTHTHDVQVRQLHNVSRIMRDQLVNKRQASMWERLRHELDMAVAEQDFASAQRLRDELRLQEAREPTNSKQPQNPVGKQTASRGGNTTSTSQTSAILQRIDMAWLESELVARVGLMKAGQVARLQDPVVRLEEQLASALEDEDYERAALLKKRLEEQVQEREVFAMNSELKRALRAFKTRLQQLGNDPEKLLIYQLQTAVNAEDFEKAKNISETIKHVQAQKMLHLLQV